MARRKTPTRREENLDDFAGPDAEKDAIDRLAKSAAEANKKAGKNVGEAADETVGMHVNLIKAAKVEWRELRDKASQAQGVLRNRYKVNNPHTPGTTPWFTWNNGHQVGAEKLAENLRTGNVGGGEGAAAH